jgi:hypothetical protein
MPALKFDKYGNLEPYEISIISLKEFHDFFVLVYNESSNCHLLFGLYTDFCLDFSSEFTTEFVHWIDGSFTTKKENPNDIDVAILVEYSDELNEKADILMKFTSKGYAKQNYSIDSYIIPVYDIRDSRYIYTQEAVQYWKNWFSFDRNQRKKGFIQINYPI